MNIVFTACHKPTDEGTRGCHPLPVWIYNKKAKKCEDTIIMYCRMPKYKKDNVFRDEEDCKDICMK